MNAPAVAGTPAFSIPEEVIAEIARRSVDLAKHVGPLAARGAELLVLELRGSAAVHTREALREAEAAAIGFVTPAMGHMIGSTAKVIPKGGRTEPLTAPVKDPWEALQLRYRDLVATGALSPDQQAALKVLVDEVGSGRRDAFLREKLLGIKPAGPPLP